MLLRQCRFSTSGSPGMFVCRYLLYPETSRCIVRPTGQRGGMRVCMCVCRCARVSVREREIDELSALDRLRCLAGFIR